jgi:hypothetical protein
VTLGFRAGREAAEHHLYLSTDEQAVIDGNAPVSSVTETSFDPLSLELGTTYYWKVNEVNEAETTTTWQGEIWNFSTPEFFVVDDFEDYNDYQPDEIFSTWIDGWEVSANGALAANADPPWAETTTVHSGDQAMPFFYSNTGTALYSEATRTFAVPQDWTAAGIQALALYLHGSPGNTGQLYVKVNGSNVPYDGDAADIAKPRWKQWNIDLASFGVDLQSVTTLAIGIDGIGASGTLYFDDFRLGAALPIIVPDAGFDDQVLPAGGYTYVGEDPWGDEDLDYPGPWQSAGGDSWIQNYYYPPPDGLQAMSGDNFLYAGEGAEDTVYQVLDETFIGGATYTLSVWVGQAWSGYGTSWTLYFTEKNYQNNLIETSGDAPVGSWEQVSLEYTATGADSGNKIGIKMKGPAYLAFDDVTLFYSSDE